MIFNIIYFLFHLLRWNLPCLIFCEKDKKYKSQQCYDPKKENYCTYIALKCRKRRNKELYKDVILADCIIKNNEINA